MSMHEFTRSWTLKLEVEDATGDVQEHVVGEGHAEIELNEVYEDEGYDPQSGNSMTMDRRGRWFLELDRVKVDRGYTFNSIPIGETIAKQIDQEIMDEAIEVDE
jgi:hypothetical protein